MSGWSTGIIRSTISGNTAVSEGGGLLGGNFTITESTISKNSAQHGGAIFDHCAATTTSITSSTLSGNSASKVGGAVTTQGSLSIINSPLSNNASFEEGGAIVQTTSDSEGDAGTLSEDARAEGGRCAAALDRLTGHRRAHAANQRLGVNRRQDLWPWFCFLVEQDVGATNWLARQALRPVVVTRNVQGGNRTWRGAWG